jgi:hypothetical protein
MTGDRYANYLPQYGSLEERAEKELWDEEDFLIYEKTLVYRRHPKGTAPRMRPW